MPAALRVLSPEQEDKADGKATVMRGVCTHACILMPLLDKKIRAKNPKRRQRASYSDGTGLVNNRFVVFG